MYYAIFTNVIESMAVSVSVGSNFIMNKCLLQNLGTKITLYCCWVGVGDEVCDEVSRSKSDQTPTISYIIANNKRIRLEIVMVNKKKK